MAGFGNRNIGPPSFGTTQQQIQDSLPDRLNLKEIN
jgi:hypothetical protein